MKKECKIVQDLLPNYIEKVTNSETNEFIGEHLKGCQECNNIYNSMKENLKVEQLDTSGEINYMRKFKNKMKILKLIIFFILLAIVFIVARRTIIMTVLNIKGEKIRGTEKNYYIKRIAYGDGYITEVESYHKDEKCYLTTIKHSDANGVKEEMIIYENGEDKVSLLHNKDGKIILKNSISGEWMPFMDTSTFFSNLQEAFVNKVEKININSKECYVIKYRFGERFIDKETGFVIRTVDYDHNRFEEYYYEFGVVKDEDIQRPDTTGYVLVD